MYHDPLQPPEGPALLRDFAHQSGLHLVTGSPGSLAELATAFTRLPYENLTKILKEATSGSAAEARRHPGEVLGDHTRMGTGGTCFSLTATLLHLVRALGWQAEPLLADRHYGPDTHSAVLVWIQGRPHLLDPGYLLVRPIPLPEEGELRVPTAFNEVVLTAREGGTKVDLHTIQQGQRTYRLTFKTRPADRSEFLRAWDVSFDSDLMTYPVLTQVRGGQQIYLQQNRLMVRGKERTRRTELDPEQLLEFITREFGIAPDIAAKALHVLERKGTRHGAAAAP